MQVTSIERVESQLHVISSKQRPRKCTMLGNDGRTYQYLLKGHEDLRQDERLPVPKMRCYYIACFQ